MIAERAFTLRDALHLAVEGKHLSRAQAAAAVEAILSGTAAPAQVAALLVALRMKGETHEEITGAAQTLRARASAVRVSLDRLIDTCGTGGDGAQTFNISTCAAFVAAAGGARVAKHGNRAVSSQCGSADVLLALGVELELSNEGVAACIESCGIGFLFAPRHHAAMRHVAPIRQELGLRTLFNLLGPLSNPAGARRQLMGVYQARLVPLIARALLELGAERALVVHGEGGLDEISTAGPTVAAMVDNGEVIELSITPEQLGVRRSPIEALRGGDAAENAGHLRSVLQGAPGPRRDSVLINAAGALWAAGVVDTLLSGVELARGAIDSGAALDRADRLVAQSRAEKAKAKAS